MGQSILINICSDYEEDCKYVKDPYKCWCGWDSFINENGIFFEGVDQADGYCPLLRNRQEENDRRREETT